MVRLDPQYQLDLRRRRRARCDARRSTSMDRQVAALSPGDRGAVRRFLADNRDKLERFRPCSSRRSSAGRTSLSSPHPAAAAAAAPLALARPRARPLLQRPAHPAGVLVPVEVPGHVAVQLPEPVLDPVVPGVRVRRLPPDRRLRRGHRGDGPGGARAGRRDPAGRGGATRSSSRGGGPSASAPTRGVYRSDALVINADFARAMTRLVPDRLRRRWTDAQDRAARSSPARRSCSTSASTAAATTCRTTPSTSPRTTSGTSTRSRTATSSRTTRRSTSRTPASPTRRWRRAGKSTLYVLVPVTHQHPNVDWNREKRALPRRSPCRGCRKVGIADVERRDPLRADGHARRLGPGLSRSTGAPPSTWPTTSARCSTCGRATASRTSTASTSWAAARIRAAGCR